jgi:DNA-binding transcriptional LysR family regulator
LEKELDVRLFVRNTKEVNLSENGQILYKYARQIIDLEKEIEEAFGRVKDSEKKCITIAASTIPAQYLLPKVLARFNEKYPGEQLSIMEMHSQGVAEKVGEHQVDIGFTGTVLEKKHCHYIPFYKDDLVVVTPNTEKYQKLAETSNDISWIKTENLILREEGSGTRKEAEKQLRNIGIKLEDLNVMASIQNQETIKKSVERGLGVSVLSRLATEDEVEEGRLLVFPIPGALEGRANNLVYNKNYQLSLSAERFVKVVKEVYGIKKK